MEKTWIWNSVLMFLLSNIEQPSNDNSLWKHRSRFGPCASRLHEFNTMSNDVHPLASTFFMDNGSSGRYWRNLQSLIHKYCNLESLMHLGILIIFVLDRSNVCNAGKRKSQSVISDTLVFCSSKFLILTRFSIDKGKHLIPVSCVSNTVRCSMGSKISGKCSNPKQPLRRSPSRDFNLKKLAGRLLSLLQSLKLNSRRWERWSIDGGTFSTAVSAITKCVILFGSSGNSSTFEQPNKLRNCKDSSLSMVLGRCLRRIQPLKCILFKFSARERSGISVRFSDSLRFRNFKLSICCQQREVTKKKKKKGSNYIMPFTSYWKIVETKSYLNAIPEFA